MSDLPTGPMPPRLPEPDAFNRVLRRAARRRYVRAASALSAVLVVTAGSIALVVENGRRGTEVATSSAGSESPSRSAASAAPAAIEPTSTTEPTTTTLSTTTTAPVPSTTVPEPSEPEPEPPVPSASLADCNEVERGEIERATKEEFTDQFIGTWLLCQSPSIFGTTDDVGMEIGPNGRWSKLIRDPSGSLVRLQGWGNEGSWEVVAIAMGGPVTGYQANVHVDGEGTIYLHPVWAVDPPKMRLDNNGVRQADYIEVSEPVSA